MSENRQRQFEAFFGRRLNASMDNSRATATTTSPLFSPATTLRPRAVSFMSAAKGDGISTVMLGQSPAIAMQRSRSRPSEVFYSPLSQVSSIHSASPTTLHSTSPTPANMVDMERFKEANIVQCQSPRELQQVILDLKAHGNFPFLVRTAERRLYSLQTTSACPLIEEEEPVTEIGSAGSPKNISTSLAYSYDDDDDDQENTPPTGAFHSNAKKASNHTSPAPTRLSREEELDLQVQQLSQKIVELNQTLRHDKMEFECQLRSIQQAKKASQQHAINLQLSLDKSNRTSRNISKQLEEIRAAHQSVSRQLAAEKSTRASFEQKAQDMENTLRQKVEKLTEQISRLQEAGGRTTELNNLLKNAQANFDAAKKERNGILATLISSMGQDTSRVVKMTRSERDAVVRKFIQHSKEQAETSKSAIQAMQEALSVSEEQRQKQNNVSKASSDRLQKLLVEHDKLESENKRLSADVEKLTNELTTSREKASQLLSQVREDNQKEWLKREAMFKTTIRKMQKELRASKKRTVKEEIDCQCENSGSTKEGGGELANNGAAFRVRGTVIRPLLSKGQKIGKGVRIGAESVETEKGVPSAISFCSSSAQTENNCRDARKRFPTQTKGVLKPSKYMGNSSLNAPDTLDTMRCPRPIDAFKGKTPSKNRAEFVRGNGGARGLQEKLRQVRSPLHV